MDSVFFESRIADAVSICQKNGRPQFLGFLNDTEKSIAAAFCKTRPNCMLFGGYDDADRVLFGVFPDYIKISEEAFSIKALTFSFRAVDKLSHRDFLGAILALGLSRETVGDILIEEGRAVAFLSGAAEKLVLSEIKKVGSKGVSVAKGYSGRLPSKGVLTEQSFTVASCRLDCVVAAVCSVSRTTAEELIDEAVVALNSVITKKATAKVSEGDKITVRGYGKFHVTNIGGTTKKGRLKIIIQKYI